MEARYCTFEYLYRDADNYKAYGRVLMLGSATPSTVALLRSRLIDSEYFDVASTGVPSLQHELQSLSGGPTEADHGWHEFIDLRPSSKYELGSLTVVGTLDQFISALACSSA